MKKVLFVCHGNICRSIMAQCIFQKIVDDAKLTKHFFIDSAAVSYEEIGNPIYPPARKKLIEKNVPILTHYARHIIKEDFTKFDFIICMDSSNLMRLNRDFGTQDNVYKMLHFLGKNEDVLDPWYTGDFEGVYNQIYEACKSLLKMNI